MPTQDDLMGLGMSPFLAQLLGNQPQALTATGTTAGTAAAIRSHLVEVNGQASQTGARLSSEAKIGTPYYIAAVGATAPVIYVPAGHALNGTTDGKVTFSAATGLLIMIQTRKGQWWVTGTATGTVS